MTRATGSNKGYPEGAIIEHFFKQWSPVYANKRTGLAFKWFNVAGLSVAYDKDMRYLHRK